MIDISASLSGILKANDQQPIWKVEVYDVANTVASSGLVAKYMTNSTWTWNTNVQDGALNRPYYQNNETIMQFDWRNGLPFQMLDSTLTNRDPFSVELS